MIGDSGCWVFSILELPHPQNEDSDNTLPHGMLRVTKKLQSDLQTWCVTWILHQSNDPAAAEALAMWNLLWGVWASPLKGQVTVSGHLGRQTGLSLSSFSTWGSILSFGSLTEVGSLIYPSQASILWSKANSAKGTLNPSWLFPEVMAWVNPMEQIAYMI